MDNKICFRCKDLKSLENFSIDNSTQDGHNRYCKKCYSQYRKVFHYNHTLNKDKRLCKGCNQYKDIQLFSIPTKCKYKTSYICDECQTQRKIKKIKIPKPTVRETLSQTPWIRAKYIIKNALRKHTLLKSKTGLKNEQFKSFIESLFFNGISWDNFGKQVGGWTIRWIKPPEEFDLTNPQEVMKINHFSNLKIFVFNKKVGKKWNERTKEEKKTAIEYARNWQKNNPEKIKIYRKNSSQQPTTRICRNLRSRIRMKIKNIQQRVSLSKNLGKKPKELKTYIESKWLPGMTWENYGFYGWHIDHVRPCSSFDLNNPEEIKKINHFSNLQPLWAKDNLTKGDKWEESVI